MSNHLFNRLLPEFHDYVSGDREFRFAFNRFEYLAALIYADYYVQKNPTSNKIWAPHGLFVQSGFSEVATALQEEIDQLGTDNMIVKAGAFGGSIDRLKKVKELFDNVIMTHRSAMVYEVD